MMDNCAEVWNLKDTPGMDLLISVAANSVQCVVVAFSGEGDLLVKFRLHLEKKLHIKSTFPQEVSCNLLQVIGVWGVDSGGGDWGYTPHTHCLTMGVVHSLLLLLEVPWYHPQVVCTERENADCTSSLYQSTRSRMVK